MIKAVIFDYDDTICLTEEATFHLENQIAAGMGIPPMSREVHQRTWGMPFRKALAERFPGADVDEILRRESSAMEKAAQDGLLDKIPDENLKALEELKNAGKKLAVVTLRSIAEAKHLIHESHPLSNLMDAFYHKDNSKYLKPDPRVFDEVLINFEIKPSEAVYVGDSLGDAIAANDAGLSFIAVMESGIRNEKYFDGQKVDFFAPKFTDIVDYILSD